VVHLFTFTSGQFDPTTERPNPINPIPGEGILKWLSAQLDRRQFTITEPDAEDWGWYVDVASGRRRYLVGASGDWGERGSKTYWTIQLHLSRSLWDKLSGANKLASNDALSAAIEAAVKGNPEFRNVEVERGA